DSRRSTPNCTSTSSAPRPTANWPRPPRIWRPSPAACPLRCLRRSRPSCSAQGDRPRTLHVGMNMEPSSPSAYDLRHRRLPVGRSSLHIVEAGDADAQPFVFLHGWPESSRTWHELMALGAGRVHAVAVDLPGIGGSAGAATGGSKAEMAAVVHALVADL